MTTKNSTTKRYQIPADHIQNLEIDRNGRITPRLHDLEPLENTLLSVLYPKIMVASVNVPSEQLDDYEESLVENALAQLTWNGIHYKLVGASGSAKKGKFYFVDSDHSRFIAERFQHWPQAAIVYFGILVSPCKVMLEETEAEVLVVPDHKLGTNDCRGWVRRSLFQKLKQKHDADIAADYIARYCREKIPDKAIGETGETQLEEIAKQEYSRKFLPPGRFYQFRMAFANTQAKGAFKAMDDDVADVLQADFVLPESSVKPGLKGTAAVYSGVGSGRRFRSPVVFGVREVSRQLEFESSYTLLEHAPMESIQLEVLPQAMRQVSKLTDAVGQGRYDDLLEILGHHPEKNSGQPADDSNEEFRVVEGLLLADASGEIVRHPYVNNQLNKVLARWAFKTATGGGFRLPAFALMDDGYLFLKNGQVCAGSDWIPEHTAVAQTASDQGLCVRYPIRMAEDLLPFRVLSEPELIDLMKRDVARNGGAITDNEVRELMARQIRVEGTFVLHSETAKKNGGDFDFDWVCVVEQDRFPRFVHHRLSRGLGQQYGKTKANKARDPWFNLEHVAMKARGNHIGSITDLMTSCRAAGQEDLALRLAKELQNALDSLKWQVQPDLKLVADTRQRVQQAPWLRYKNERRVSDLPLHVEVEKTDRVGHLYNHVRKQIEDLVTQRAPIEAFKGLVVGEQVTREMLENCRFIKRVYAAMVGQIAERRESFKQQLDKARSDWEQVRRTTDKELRRKTLFAMNRANGASHSDEERGRYEMKAILAFVRIWAQDKVENRLGWLQALNRVVCQGERSTGSLLFLAFPQELIVKLADRTGGKAVRVHRPRLHSGFVHTDSSGRVFLVDSLKEGGQKLTFLFKFHDGEILLDDNQPEQDPSVISAEPHNDEQPAADIAIPDDAVEFPTVTVDGDFEDAPWVM